MKSLKGKMAFGFLGMLVMAGLVLAPLAGAKPGKGGNDQGDNGGSKLGPPPHHVALSTDYRQVNLVSDIAGVARYTDPNLVNPWGIALTSSGRIWISDNGTGLSTIYSKSGTVQSLVVTIAPPAGSTNPATPTGIIANGTGAFSVSNGTTSGSALFIFATEDGTIVGWNPSVDPTNSFLMADNSSANAVYKGIAAGSDNSSNRFIFVTNFHDGTVEKYDTNMTMVSSFTDSNLPAGYAPFGIENINGKLFVTFAAQDADKHDDVSGPGNGFVDVFDVEGTLVRHFAANGTLNSPWAVVHAPNGFGEFGGAVLVGNFGDGTINAFALNSGTFLGQLTDPRGNAIAIDSLWGLRFSNPPTSAKAFTKHGDCDDDDVDVAGQVLYFTAGIGGEGHGLFGKIKPVIKKHVSKFWHD